MLIILYAKSVYVCVYSAGTTKADLFHKLEPFQIFVMVFHYTGLKGDFEFINIAKLFVKDYRIYSDEKEKEITARFKLWLNFEATYCISSILLRVLNKLL